MNHPARIDVATVALAPVPDAHWPRLAALLSEPERRRAAAFHFEHSRREYIAAHALKRWMLSAAAGGDPRDWRFAAGPWGKPVVADRDGPHFNLSHAEGLVACALSPDVPVGIDVEPADRRAPIDVATRFSPDERSWLLDLPESERQPGFFRLWTMKEAVVKATGRGMAQALDSFAVGFDPLRVNWADAPRAETGHWRLVQRTVGGRHLLALAWIGPEAIVTLREVPWQALAKRATEADSASPDSAGCQAILRRVSESLETRPLN